MYDIYNLKSGCLWRKSCKSQSKSRPGSTNKWLLYTSTVTNMAYRPLQDSFILFLFFGAKYSASWWCWSSSIFVLLLMLFKPTFVRRIKLLRKWLRLSLFLWHPTFSILAETCQSSSVCLCLFVFIIIYSKFLSQLFWLSSLKSINFLYKQQNTALSSFINTEM